MIMLYEKQKIIWYKVSYLIENKTVIGEIESLTELSEYFIHQENNLIRKIKLGSLFLFFSLFCQNKTILMRIRKYKLPDETPV